MFLKILHLCLLYYLDLAETDFLASTMPTESGTRGVSAASWSPTTSCPGRDSLSTTFTSSSSSGSGDNRNISSRPSGTNPSVTMKLDPVYDQTPTACPSSDPSKQEFEFEDLFTFTSHSTTSSTAIDSQKPLYSSFTQQRGSGGATFQSQPYHIGPTRVSFPSYNKTAPSRNINSRYLEEQTSASKVSGRPTKEQNGSNG